MKMIHKNILLSLFYFLASVFLTSQLAGRFFISEAYALQVTADKKVTIEEERTIEENIAVLSEDLKVKGKILRNIFFLSRKGVVEGDLRGDLIGGAKEIDLKGEIGDDVFLVAKIINSEADIKGSLLFGAQSVEINGGKVWQDVVGVCEEADIRGDAGGDLFLVAKEIRISGRVLGNARLNAERIVLLSSSVIEGDLNYTSPRNIELQEGAQVKGNVNWNKPKTRTRPSFTWMRKMRLQTRIYSFLSILLIGVVLVSLSPRKILSIEETLRSTPGRSIGFGALFVFLTPLGLFFIMLSIIGIPLSLIGFFLYFLILYISKIFISVIFGRLIIKREGKGPLLGALAVGLLILYILTSLPVIGFLVSVATALFGSGAFLISQRQFYFDAKEKELI
ncbi:MAG TPA: polymer-forming cytoskeletal protein [Candidatus Omnitrophica bacterium]|nr:polymer-forming cytoskeletal protein [Candidatus Omnitrophota bacterium]